MVGLTLYVEDAVTLKDEYQALLKQAAETPPPPKDNSEAAVEARVEIPDSHPVGGGVNDDNAIDSPNRQDSNHASNGTESPQDALTEDIRDGVYHAGDKDAEKRLWKGRLNRLCLEVLKADPEYHKAHLTIELVLEPLRAEIFERVRSGPYAQAYPAYAAPEWMDEDEIWAIVGNACEVAWEAFRQAERNQLLLEHAGNGAAPARRLALICEDQEQAVVTNAEYLSRPVIIEKLGFAQSIALMIGGKHHGKTTNIRTLALSVARGLPIWGRATTQGPVIYVASDDEVAATRNELLNMGWAKGTDPLRFVRLDPDSEATPEEILEDIGSIALNFNAILIILDMLFDFVGIKDELSYVGTRQPIGLVQRLADNTKALVVGSHHTPKYLTDAHQAANAALGSQGVSARFSPIIFTRKWTDGLYTVESTMTRDPRGEELRPHKIIRNDKGWIETTTAFKEKDKWEIYAQRVLDLFDGDRGYSVQSVAEKLGLDRSRVQNTLKELERIGKLKREKQGRRYQYYLASSDMFERKGGNFGVDG